MNPKFDLCGYDILRKEFRVYQDKYSGGTRLVITKEPTTEYYLEEVTDSTTFQELMFEYVHWTLNLEETSYVMAARINFTSPESGFLISNRSHAIGREILDQIRKIEEIIGTGTKGTYRPNLTEIFNNNFIYTTDKMDKLFVSHWMLNLPELNLVTKRYQFVHLVQRVSEYTKEVIDECDVYIGYVCKDPVEKMATIPKESQ